MEQFMKLPPGQKAAVFFGAVALLGVGMYFLMVAPEIERGDNARKDLAKAERDLAALKTEATPEEEERLQKRKDELIEANKEHRKMLPSPDNVSTFIGSVQRDAEQLGLRATFQTRPVEMHDMYLASPVNIVGVEGTMTQLMQFLRLYAGSERQVVQIRDLRVERVKRDAAVLKEAVRARELPGAAAAAGTGSNKTPEDELLERIAIAEEERRQSLVRAQFVANALFWTGKPAVKNENGPSAQKKKRKRS